MSNSNDIRDKHKNEDKKDNYNNRNTRLKKTAAKALLCFSLTLGAPCALQEVKPNVAQAKYLDKYYYNDKTYGEIREKFEAVNEMIQNEQKIIDGEQYTEKEKENAIAQKKKYEHLKDLYNELLIMKGKGYSKEQKEIAQKTFDYKEKKYLNYIWYHYWDRIWELCRKTGKGFGTIIGDIIVGIEKEVDKWNEEHK